MNDFPRMLYRMPGAEPLHGGLFSTLVVAGEAEQDAALADGWHLTTPEAKDAAEQAARPAPADADAPPTRAELEQKAGELGIKFDGRTSDKKLAALIAEKLGG